VYTIWLRLKFSAIETNFISPEDLILAWREKGDLGRKIMPILEAAHIGPIPTTAVDAVFEFQNGAFVFCK
jgi:hypothetical protein